MNNDNYRSASSATDLRRRAEEQLVAQEPEMTPLTDIEAQRLIHELQVHRIELEMQNAELRQARDAREELLEKFSVLYDFAPVGYCTIDRKGIIGSVNLAGASLLGTDRSRLIGRRLDHFIARPSRHTVATCLEQAFTSQGKEVCEAALPTEGNQTLTVQIEAVADAAGNECRLALIDITERKRAEEVLRRATRAAEETTRAKSQFLAHMSHELRTPMTGILGLLQLALMEELAPKPREYLEMTMVSARSLLRILNDILDLAKIVAGKVTLDEQIFSPRGCIAEAVDIITPEARRKGLDVAVVVEAETPVRMVGDRERLRQVLINLIGNAVKFTDVGNVLIRVTAGQTTGGGKREVTYSVADTGIGIAEENRELLFQAFSQVDRSNSRRFGGTGLGLAISRELVHLMGGAISFVSEEGAGSTFSFTIPLGEAPPEHDAGIHEPQSADRADSPCGGERIPHILLAEDNPVNRDVIGLLLVKRGFRLDFAEDGVQAVAMWETGNYDLVLMDVHMPRLDGLKATRSIRERERERGGHTPIIAVTAHAFKDDRDRCLDAGMDAYIAKPIDFPKCIDLMNNLLGAYDRRSDTSAVVGPATT
jgi:PAS domain S-box-containing protein